MPLPSEADGVLALLVLHNDPQPLILEMSKLQGFYLLSHLQLALRHPGNRGATAAEVRRIALQIQHAVCTTPTLHALAEAGWENQG